MIRCSIWAAYRWYFSSISTGWNLKRKTCTIELYLLHNRVNWCTISKPQKPDLALSSSILWTSKFISTSQPISSSLYAKTKSQATHKNLKFTKTSKTEKTSVYFLKSGLHRSEKTKQSGTWLAVWLWPSCSKTKICTKSSSSKKTALGNKLQPMLKIHQDSRRSDACPKRAKLWTMPWAS